MSVCDARPTLGDKVPIRQMQALLNKAGHYHIPEDGDFGRNTENTVRDWQSKNGLACDGIVGPQTWPTLCDSVCDTTPTLKNGSDDKRAVTQMQGLLNKAGQYHIPEDGDFGRNTENTVRDWQSKNGLARDGIVGPQTWPTLCISVCDTKPTLKNGSDDKQAVAQMQGLLNKAGQYRIPEDGDFGRNTENTVRNWQSRNGLSCDGIVGPQTWPTLCDNIVCATRPELRRGSTDKRAVREMQSLLNDAGNYKIPQDGDFGWNTENTVKDWQHKNDRQVDGVVGPQTWATICGCVCKTRPTLGDKNAIRQMQALLNKAGGYRIPEDGYFGGNTNRTVLDWQKRSGLYCDGIVGPQTWQTLCLARNRIIPAVEANQLLQGPNPPFYIDVRPPPEYFAAHGPTAVNVPVWLDGIVPTFVEDVLKVASRDTTLLLSCKGGKASAMAADILDKAGFTDLTQIEGGFNAWKATEPKLPISRIIPATEANDLLQSPDRPFYIDVRPPPEYFAGHGPTAVNVPVWLDGIVPTFVQDVLKVASEDTTLLLSCKGGKASAMAAGLLEKAGFMDLTQIEGGFNAWKATVPELPISRIIPATEANDLLQGPDRPFYIDVRPPPEHYAGHGPTAVNVPVWLGGIVPTFVQDVLKVASEDTTLLLSCKGGKASAMAAGLLEKACFMDLTQIEGGFNAWKATVPKLPISRIIPPLEANNLLQGPNPPFYIDVRPPPEYQAGHGPTAVNVPVWLGGLVPTFVEDVLKVASEDTTLLLSCKGGKASAMAAGLLEKAGFMDLTQIEGGFNAWLATRPELPVEK